MKEKLKENRGFMEPVAEERELLVSLLKKLVAKY
jgi:hypothetical protein